MATRGECRLGIDVGKVRVGVAHRDPDGILATPLVTLARDLHARQPGRRARATSPSSSRLVAEYEAVEVVVGLPVTPAGRKGLRPSTLGHMR